MGLPQSSGRAKGLEAVAGWLFIAAGAIHGVVTPAHFDEWVGYGLFFLFASVLQVVWGLALLTNAINPEDAGPRWHAWKTGVYVLGILGTIATIILYVITRTVGIPYFGPEAGEVEGVGFLDVLSKLVELALVGILFVLLQRHRALR